MSLRNPYEALLPAWRAFCAERRACMASRADHFTGDIKGSTHIDPEHHMRKALSDWGNAVDVVCGPYATVEWPDDTRIKPKLPIIRESPYVEGSCIVAGVMLFSDESYSITT